MDTTFLTLTYALYAAIAVPLVVWLARTLTANGAAFLTDVFQGREELGLAINRLLGIGFLLLNLGYALLLLTSGNEVTTALAAMELLIRKLGTLLFSLGLLHFLNMLVFWRIGRGDDPDQLPVAPTVVLPPAAPQPPMPAPGA